ncbi:MAG: hypothetical protein MUE81_00225 [Thermoflexibacter sp.]|jgi:hypothetical protein|nr:hypothetical protein [Thermoflexibacter sp.]
MKIPTIHGYIDHRILINFTADPKAVEKIIPSPFRPKVYNVEHGWKSEVSK